MKNIVKKMLLIFVSSLILFSSVGCNRIGILPNKNNDKTTTEPVKMCPIIYEFKSDKKGYALGEEITLELLFNTFNGTLGKDGYTYCVKIVETPFYEIVGDSEVYTAGSIDEPYVGYRGEDNPYWYKAVFKVKVNKETVGHEGFEIVIKCVDNDWLEPAIREYAFEQTFEGNRIYNIEDTEFPFKLPYFTYDFYANPDGVWFPKRVGMNNYR